MPASSARTFLARALQRSRVPSLLLTAGLLCCACGRKEDPATQKAPPAYGIPQQRATNTSTALPGQSPEANRMERERQVVPDGRTRFEEPPLKAAADQGTAQDEKKDRDYGAELAQQLNKSVPGCLGSFSPSTTSVTISVTAQVMSSGMVSRAEASASGLTPAILACIKKLAASAQLQAPVADAPRSVQAQLTLQTQGTPKAAQLKAAPAEEFEADQRDENPRDSKVPHVENDPVEVEQKLYEHSREGTEVPDPKDEPPADNHTD